MAPSHNTYLCVSRPLPSRPRIVARVSPRFFAPPYVLNFIHAPAFEAEQSATCSLGYHERIFIVFPRRPNKTARKEEVAMPIILWLLGVPLTLLLVLWFFGILRI